MPNSVTKERRLCSACEEGRHHDCSMSNSCECDCDGEALDYGHDPDLDENGICRVCGEFEPE